MVQIPLGVLLKNENKQEDMISILEHLTQYVPYTTKEDLLYDEIANEMVPLVQHEFHKIIVGGDQLTVERIRGCQKNRSNANEAIQTFKCFCSAVEDWHSEVALLKV